MGRNVGLAVVAAAVLLVAGCGGADGETATEDGGADVVTSPLSEFLGFGDFDYSGEEGQARLIEEQRAREEAIASCMREAGFEYIPQDPSQFMSFGEVEEFDQEAYVNKYGFGVTTQWFSQKDVGPNLIGYDDSEMSGTDIPDDPNAAIVEAMDDAERDAYYAALYGDQPAFEFDESMSEEEQQAAMEDMSFEPSGCQAEAMADEANQELANRFYEEFGDEMEQLYERVASDPRIVEAEREVKDCVTEKGFPNYPGQNGVYELWQPAMEELSSQVVYPGADLTEDDYATMTEEELNEIFNQPVQIEPAALERLGELQTEELAMAKAVFECGGFDENQGQMFQEIYVEYEQKFLDENRARLDELKAEVG